MEGKYKFLQRNQKLIWGEVVVLGRGGKLENGKEVPVPAEWSEGKRGRVAAAAEHVPCMPG